MQECSKKNRCGKIACPSCIRFHEQKNKSASVEEDAPQRKKGSEDSSKRKRYDIKFLSVDANPLQFDIGRLDMTDEHRSKMDSGCGHTVVTTTTASAICKSTGKKTSGCSAMTCSGEVLAVTGAVAYGDSAFPHALVVEGLKENLLSVADLTNRGCSVLFPATDLGCAYGVIVYDDDGRISMVGDSDYMVDPIGNETIIKRLPLMTPAILPADGAF